MLSYIIYEDRECSKVRRTITTNSREIEEAFLQQVGRINPKNLPLTIHQLGIKVLEYQPTR